MMICFRLLRMVCITVACEKFAFSVSNRQYLVAEREEKMLSWVNRQFLLCTARQSNR